MSAGLLAHLAYEPPAEVTGPLDQVLGYLAWLVTAAGVAGLMFVGTRMAVALRTGDGEEHLRAYLLVLAACVIGASAGPLVQFVGLDLWNTEG
jgi:hypothetical protein